MSPRSKKERFPVKGQRKPWAVNRSLEFLIMNNSLEHSRHVHTCIHAHKHTPVSLSTDSQLAIDQESNSRPSYQSSIPPPGTVWLSLCGRHPTSFPVQRGYCSAAASKAPCCLGAPDGNQMCGSGMHRLAQSAPARPPAQGMTSLSGKSGGTPERDGVWGGGVDLFLIMSTFPAVSDARV